MSLDMTFYCHQQTSLQLPARHECRRMSLSRHYEDLSLSGELFVGESGGRMYGFCRLELCGRVKKVGAVFSQGKGKCEDESRELQRSTFWRQQLIL